MEGEREGEEEGERTLYSVMLESLDPESSLLCMGLSAWLHT